MNEFVNTENELKEAIAEVIAENIKEGSNICDVGFDNVWLIKKLTAKNKKFSYHGTDIFDEVVCTGQDYVKEEGLENCIIEKIPFGEFNKKGFNTSVCVRLFHHFSKEDTIFFLKKMVSVIGGEGEMYLADSIRDFNGREDRFSYTPYFYLNEISKIVGSTFEIEYCEDAQLDVGEIWIMKFTISKSGCKCKMLKTK